MNEIKIGQSVVGIEAHDDNDLFVGVNGKVIGIGETLILVEFESDISGHDGHNAHGIILDDYDKEYKLFPVGKQDHCWYINLFDWDDYLKVIDEYKTELI